MVRAVRKVSPAVVNISSEYEVRKQVSPFSGYRMDPFFDSFFKDFFDPGNERRYTRNSLGSGVIIDGQRGFILTNAHVVEKTGTIRVVLNDQEEYAAQVVGADPDSDLAVLRIESKTPLPAIDMGDSDNLMIGETVIAIGNPFGFSHTVTTGVISALNRSFRIDDRVFQDFIQTDASINPGNSGGPLLNINGELVGINTAIYAKAQGIGFAIPINKAKRIINDLIRYGEVIPAWIGITVQDIDKRLAKYLKMQEAGGVLVIINYRWLGRSLFKLLSDPQLAAEKGFKRNYLFRLVFIASSIYLLLVRGEVHPLALVVGLSVVVLNLIVTTAKRLY